MGRGHRARIRVDVARAQLKQRLDITQRLATGRAKLDATRVREKAASLDEAQPVEEHIKAERLAQLRHFNKRAAEEEALRAGTYVKAEDVRQQFGAVAARMLSTFEASFMPIANAIVASRAQTPRDVLRAMRSTWREIRAQAAKAQGEEALALAAIDRRRRLTMLLSNPERIAIETVAAALEPPPALDLLDWAERNIVFDDGPFPGPYSRALFPFFDEVLRALGPDDPCRIRQHVRQRASGKNRASRRSSLSAQMTTSRGSFMVVHPTEDNAIRWSEDEACADDALDRRRARSFSRSAPTMRWRRSCTRNAGWPGPAIDHRRELAPLR